MFHYSYNGVSMCTYGYVVVVRGNFLSCLPPRFGNLDGSGGIVVDQFQTMGGIGGFFLNFQYWEG